MHKVFFDISKSIYEKGVTNMPSKGNVARGSKI